MDRKYDVITLGEILLRLSTPINGRLAQGDTSVSYTHLTLPTKA